jgi:hypothetical protein
MPQFVHVARILPGQKDAFCDYIRTGFETAKPALRSFGFTRVTSFYTPEASDDGGGLLVTIYEAESAEVVKRFYELPVVIQNEEKAHGMMVAPHDHNALPTNTPFLDLDLRE